MSGHECEFIELPGVDPHDRFCVTCNQRESRTKPLPTVPDVVETLRKADRTEDGPMVYYLAGVELHLRQEGFQVPRNRNETVAMCNRAVKAGLLSTKPLFEHSTEWGWAVVSRQETLYPEQTAIGNLNAYRAVQPKRNWNKEEQRYED